MNTTHLKCPKCGGGFDFEERSNVRRPGISAMPTIKYSGREMTVHVIGFSAHVMSIAHIAVHAQNSTLKLIHVKA